MTGAPARPGIVTTEHRLTVPLDHARPTGATLELFARAVRGSDGATRPWLVFLQGGPGFEAARPDGAHGWIGRALRDYSVLLVDQRGTGLSSPIEVETLLALPSDDARASYLSHFRADSIVRDCELWRRELIGDQPWSVLGQSFGGFCATSYLSLAPEGLREAYLTGGLPPLVDDAAVVYEALLAELRSKTERFFEAFPEDLETLRRLADRATSDAVALPRGGRMSVRQLRSIGLQLGVSDGPARLHHLLERAFDGDRITYAFRRGLEDLSAFDTNPLYALLHEPCYARGFATRWAAERVLKETELEQDETTFALTGEIVLRSSFEDSDLLRPLLGTAERLAEKDDWPDLYDLERLAANEVPVTAAVYAEDLFVDRDLSLATSDLIRGARVWVTNEFEHNGLRADGERVLGRLIAMRRGEA
ncbi:MAG: alpha/beta fold hydrolase [Planctomycetota bacterium]